MYYDGWCYNVFKIVMIMVRQYVYVFIVLFIIVIVYLNLKYCKIYDVFINLLYFNEYECICMF